MRIDLVSKGHKGSTTSRGDAVRAPDMTINFPDDVRGDISHVGWASSGLMVDVPDPSRNIAIILGDMKEHDGMFALMDAKEARVMGESLIRLADEAYQSKIKEEVGV